MIYLVLYKNVYYTKKDKYVYKKTQDEGLPLPTVYIYVRVKLFWGTTVSRPARYPELDASYSDEILMSGSR
jgi:hypothetical protein